MISFALICKAGHEFEGWFRNSADFETQASKKVVSCPVCGSHEVTKGLQAPRVSGTKKSTTQTLASPDPDTTKLVEMMRQLRNHVVENSDYVGDKFAEEARKIHYGESDERPIYGETSEEEAEALDEEGVGVTRIPWLPRENS